MYLSIVLLAIIMLATTGANTALMTFIPLRYKNSGITSGISGILNAFSYADQLLRNNRRLYLGRITDGSPLF